jgi:hypothetical protein
MHVTAMVASATQPTLINKLLHMYEFTAMSASGMKGTVERPTAIQPGVRPSIVNVNVCAVALMLHQARKLPVVLIN